MTMSRKHNIESSSFFSRSCDFELGDFLPKVNVRIHLKLIWSLLHDYGPLQQRSYLSIYTMCEFWRPAIVEDSGTFLGCFDRSSRLIPSVHSSDSLKAISADIRNPVERYLA